MGAARVGQRPSRVRDNFTTLPEDSFESSGESRFANRIRHNLTLKTHNDCVRVN
jgi:hypothetical protein